MAKKYTNSVGSGIESITVSPDGTSLIFKSLNGTLYTISVSDWNALTDVRANKIDKIIIDGDGAKVLCDDGTYKSLSIPTKTSELINDNGFITKSVSNLENYYLQTQTYTKDEINALINNIPAIKIKVVDSLPINDISETTIYLIKQSGNNYTQYMYINQVWSILGGVEVDLSNYYTKTQVNSLMNNKVDKVDGMGLSSNNFTDQDKLKLNNLEPYVLPVSSVDVLGGVKIDGTSILINDGVISSVGEGTINYNLLENKPSINNIELSGNKSLSDLGINIPTKTSQLTNDSNFVSDSGYVHTDNNFTTAEKSKLSTIESDAQVNKIEVVKVNNTALDILNKSINISVPTKLSELSNDSGFITKDISNLTNYYTKSIIDTSLSSKADADDLLLKQNKTDSGLSTTNKTIVGAINEVNTSISNKIEVTNIKAGSNITLEVLDNDITISSNDCPTVSYNDVTEKPTINGVELSGNKTSTDLGIIIPTKTSQLTNDTFFVSDDSYVHTDNNFTTVEKSKLAGISDNAEVNAINTVKVNNVALDITNKSVNITTPTKLSELSNDSGFIDVSVNNLDNYYTKTAVDTSLSSKADKTELLLKQDKTDDSLSTTSKTIVGAINEVNSKSLPTGGTVGQILSKKTTSNYDVQWIDNQGILPDNLVYFDNSSTTIGSGAITAENSLKLGGELPTYYAKQSDIDVLNNDRGYLNTKIITGDLKQVTANGKYISNTTIEGVEDIYCIDVTNFYYEGNTDCTQIARGLYMNNIFSRTLTSERWSRWSTIIQSRDLCNVNLLDNTLFTNPYNQRGKSVYTSSGYTIDRWHCDIDGTGSVSLDPQGIRLELTSGSSIALSQRFERPFWDLLMAKDLTVTLLFNSLIYSRPIKFYSSSGYNEVDLDGTLKVGYETLDDYGYIKIYLPVANEVRIINKIKLEFGVYSTLINELPIKPQTNISECQRYCEVGTITINKDLNGSDLEFIPYKVTKRIEKPTVTIKSANGAIGYVSYFDGSNWVDVQSSVITEWNTSYGFGISFANVPVALKRNIRFSFESDCEL